MSIVLDLSHHLSNAAIHRRRFEPRRGQQSAMVIWTPFGYDNVGRSAYTTLKRRSNLE